jgi:AcrR family transcriptional regulator
VAAPIPDADPVNTQILPIAELTRKLVNDHLPDRGRPVNDHLPPAGRLLEKCSMANRSVAAGLPNHQPLARAIAAGSEGTTGTPEASTRARILASAERLFAEQGFSGVTMPMIAKASGITAGAIYKHFDSKAALFFEVIRGAVESTVVSAAARPGGMTLPNVVAGFTTRGRRRFRQLAVEIHSASLKHPEVRRLLRRSVDGQIADISSEIIAGQRAGTLEPADSPELLASAIMVFIMGLMHMETLVPQLVGNEEWTDLVASRIALLLGARSQSEARPPYGPKGRHCSEDASGISQAQDHPVDEGDGAENRAD